MAINFTTLNIDFEVLKTNTCKYLKVMDLSNWASHQEDAAYIQVITPGSKKPVTHILRKGVINVFNINNLNLSDVKDYSYLGPLPDGVYQITIAQCENDPFAITKYHLQDCQLRCQATRKLISIDLICGPCKKNSLSDIQEVLFFLDAAQAQVDSCNVNKASEYYRRASLLFSRIEGKKVNCNCN